MTVYGFGIARSVRSLEFQRASLVNCCSRGRTVATVDCIDFCPLEETCVLDLKSLKDLLEVIGEGDTVWSLSRRHVSNDAGEILKYIELITKKGARVLFSQNRFSCTPKEFEHFKKWTIENEEAKAKKTEAKQKNSKKEKEEGSS